jgi:FkbM family methyltransferase
MNSYDVFDTIIGRLCYKGYNIFEILEQKFNLLNFKNNRMNAESVGGGINNFYKYLECLYGIDLIEIKNYELYLEKKMSFPINKYLNMISESDILVSDMYLDEDIILELINQHKVIKNKLYVSSSHKADSSFWRRRDICDKIKVHYGDNYISDYKNAIDNNINAEYIDNVELTDTEKLIERVNKYIAYLIRAIRLTTQNSNKVFNNIFNEITLPIGILICISLRKYVLTNGIEVIYFLSRDGYWFKQIYNILFPNDITEYEYFSRLYLENQRNVELFKERHNNSKRKLFFDLYGTGTTFKNKIGKVENGIYYLCFSWILNNEYSIFNKDYIYSTCKNLSYIEDIFIAPHGTIGINGEICLPEYEIKILEPYFNNLNIFKKYYNILNEEINIMNNLNNIDINEIIKEILHKDYSFYIKHIEKNINHINSHNQEYKGYYLEYYSQIEQDKFYIENIAKFKCNGFFVEIGGYDGITGSNTYYLEKNLNWDGIVIECFPESFDKCKINRKCKLVDRAIYKISNETIEMLIPEGEEISGGNKQLCGLNGYIKNESLMHFNNSYKKSRIINVKTVSFNDLMEDNNVKEIDYLSLDIEGYELEVLKTINFKKYIIKYLTVEHGNVINYKNDINNFLTSNGFRLYRNNAWDDEYIRIN